MSIFKLLDCFPCLYRRTEKGSRSIADGVESNAYVTYMIIQGNSPVNAKLTSLSYVHQYIFFSATYTLTIVTPPKSFFPYYSSYSYSTLFTIMVQQYSSTIKIYKKEERHLN